MTATIWKFALNPQERQDISVIDHHVGPAIHAGTDPAGALCVWAEVRPMQPDQRSRAVLEVYVLGTGHDMPLAVSAHRARHVGSAVVDGDFVFHVYAEEATR